MSDSFELRMREMAADRLNDAAQFAGTKEAHPGGSTSLLLGMCDTLRACMRDWPGVEDGSESARRESLARLQATIKEARRQPRSTVDDSLVFVLADALSIVAEQWPQTRTTASFNQIAKEEASHKRPAREELVADTTSLFNSVLAKRPRSPSTPSTGPRVETCTSTFVLPRPSPIDTRTLIAPLQSTPAQDSMSANDHLNMFLASTMDGTTVKEEEDTSVVVLDEDDPMWLASVDSSASSPDFSRMAKREKGTTQMMTDGTNQKMETPDGRLKNFKYFCALCGLGCISRAQLDSHMNVHTGARPFECRHCEKNYKRKDHLSDHVKKTHPGEYRSMREVRQALKHSGHSVSA